MAPTSLTAALQTGVMAADDQPRFALIALTSPSSSPKWFRTTSVFWPRLFSRRRDASHGDPCDRPNASREGFRVWEPELLIVDEQRGRRPAYSAHYSRYHVR